MFFKIGISILLKENSGEPFVSPEVFLFDTARREVDYGQIAYYHCEHFGFCEHLDRKAL
jgi:hypothetical protein